MTADVTTSDCDLDLASGDVAEPGGREARSLQRIGLPAGRTRRAVIASLLGLCFAVGSAVSPAHEQRTSVTWPTTPPLSSELGRAIGGSVLLIARDSAERLSVRLPCAAAPSVPGFLFATEQHPQTYGGLLIATVGDALVVTVGTTVIATVPGWVATGECGGAVDFAGTHWRITKNGIVTAQGNSTSPSISGLFAPTALLTARPASISATVLTEVQGSRPSVLQWILRVLAGVALIAAAASMIQRTPNAVRVTWRRSLGALDVAVVAVLGVWSVVGPAFLDDGWIMQTAEHRYPGGEFRGFYQPHDSWVPLGFAHYTLHWLISLVTTQLVFFRLAILTLLVLGWLTLRVGLGRLVPRTSRVAWACGAAGYLVFSMAWLMTLRAEPLIASISAVVLAVSVAYIRTRNVGWLLLGGAAAALAASMHPAGTVAATPLLVLVPTVVREIRAEPKRFWMVFASIAAVCALLILLVFADSDVRVWLANKAAFGTDGVHAFGWRAELERYRLLLFGSYDTVVRRASVLFGLCVVALFLIGFDRRRSILTVLPSVALGLSLALLMASPSKWPWHFGTLGLIASAALTVEIHELGSTARRLSISHGVLVIGFSLVGAIAWRSSEGWGVFNFVQGINGFVQIGRVLSNPLLPAFVCGLVAAALTWKTRDRTRSALRAVRLMPIIVLAPMIVATTIRFSTQAEHGSYSLARQNIRALKGAGDCGAAPLLMVDLPQASIRADPVSGLSTAANSFTNGDVGPLAATDGAFYDDGLRPGWASSVTGTYVTGNDDVGWAAGPWQTIPVGTSGLFAGVTGRVGGGNEFILQRGLRSGADVTVTDSFNLSVVHDSESWARVALGRWTVSVGTVARIVIVDKSTGFGSWLAVSPITVVPTQSLQSLSDSGVQIMVSPFYRAFMPCIHEPDQPGGIAAQPDLVIEDLPVSPTSPSSLIQDVFGRTRIPIILDGDQVLNADAYEAGYTWATVAWKAVRTDS